MPKLKSKDLARIADHAAIRGASRFYVNWFVGRDQWQGRPERESLWQREEFDTLAAARARRDQVGRDDHGRTGLVYAHCANGMSLHVDEGFQG
jgi:hypothetical protein